MHQGVSVAVHGAQADERRAHQALASGDGASDANDQRHAGSLAGRRAGLKPAPTIRQYRDNVRIGRCSMPVVLQECQGAVGVVTLNRPEALNAWGADMAEGVVAAFGEFEADRAVRAIVLTGSGRAFSA